MEATLTQPLFSRFQRLYAGFHTCTQPSIVCAQASSTCERASSTCVRPSSTCKRPSSTCEQLSNTCERPSSTCERPSSTCERPSSTCERPSSTCERPSSTCEQPSNSGVRASSACKRSSSGGEAGSRHSARASRGGETASGLFKQGRQRGKVRKREGVTFMPSFPAPHEDLTLTKQNGEVFELREDIAQSIDMVRHGKKPSPAASTACGALVCVSSPRNPSVRESRCQWASCYSFDGDYLRPQSGKTAHHSSPPQD